MKEIEKIIGRLIVKNLPVEWIRFGMYNESDRYRNIPMLVFRVDSKCTDEEIEKLKKCIEGFKGKLKWDLFLDAYSRKRNYIVSIKELKEYYISHMNNKDWINQCEYWGEAKYKKMCDNAIEDIPMLAQKIEELYIGDGE